MTGASVMPWVLIALSVAAALYRTFIVMSKSIDHDALQAVLLKLFRSGDLSRANKLLSAIPGVPIAVAMRAVLVQVAQLSPRTDALVVRGSLEKTFGEAFDEAKKIVTASGFLTPVAVLFAAGSLATSWQLGRPPLPLVVGAGLVLLLVAQSARVSARMARRGPLLFEKTLPDLLAHACKAAASYRDPSGEVAKPVGPLQPKKDVVFIDVVRAGSPTRHLELETPVIKIGTLSTAHVPVEPEKGVGRMHAVIERGDDATVIIDLGNQAGTVVGGARISKTKLHQGDEIIVGTTTLRIGLGLPPTHLELEPIDGDDPKTWEPEAMFLYGFDTRSPDLFYEIALAIVRASPAAKGVRVVKLRRRSGAPTFAIGLLGSDAAVKVARAAIEQQAPSHYARCATPVADIAPDATYGRETSTSARVRDELREGVIDVVASVVI
jgi:hypothetical protein